ncbi:MAG: General stress protein 14 [Syntrophus sp. PtaB.Bin001]|nr:MAG: General stress protein 14 [Syntrophus sp. PtaB.Bin001]
MNRILILFAHPRFEKSRVNRALLRDIETIPAVTLNDLYELYPDFNIDAEREKTLLAEHQVIVWQHPFYMYSAPALLKQWLDIVLEYGWAHGRKGNILKDKLVFNVLTSGGSRDSYSATGYNCFTIGEFLLPFNQTANLCKMIYLPPFAVQGTYRLTEEDLKGHAWLYRVLLERLAQGNCPVESLRTFPFLNDWLLRETEGCLS